MVLGDDFTKIKEDDEFQHRWTTHLDHADKVHLALRALHNEISENDLVPEKDIISSLKKHIEKIVGEKIDEEMVPKFGSTYPKWSVPKRHGRMG